MGLAPELGRTLMEEDDKPGATPAVILGHRFWKAELGGDSNVIGRKLVIDGAPHIIAGVMPEALTFPGDFCDFWVPLQATPARYKRGDHVLAVVARLKDAGLLDEARARLSAANQRLQSTFPEYHKDLVVRVTPLHEQMIRQPERALMVLFTTVAFVLLICCSNISNLLLARAVHRRREIAIRVALGAGRWVLLRQLLIESLLLASLGGALGTVVAAWGIKLFSNAIPAGLRPAEGLSLNSHVLAFTAALSIFTCFLFGLAPLLRLLRCTGPTRCTRPDAMREERELTAARLVSWLPVRLPSRSCC
jgi:hypothetical protein